MKKIYMKLGIVSLVVLILLIIATFFDYNISVFLASNDLKNGNYYSTSTFGFIFETIGEMPVYFLLAFAAVLIGLFIINKTNKLKVLGYIFMLIGIYPLYLAYSKMGKYINNFKGISFFVSNIYLVITLILSLLTLVLMYFVMVNKINKHLKEYFIFALMILAVVLLSQVTITLIKPICARERFRAIYYFEYLATDHPGFTRWYQRNALSSQELADMYNVTKDYFKSFPSGHTGSAASLFVLLFIPFLFNKQDKKTIMITTLISTLYTIIVAIARIQVGAHYLSDVLVGGYITYLATYIVLILYKLFIEKKMIKNESN